MSRTRLQQVLEELDPYPEVRGLKPVTALVEQMRQATAITV